MIALQVMNTILMFLLRGSAVMELLGVTALGSHQ